MARQERERIGRFVVTSEENLEPDWVVCALCQRRLASLNSEAHLDPSVEALVQEGAVPVPNFGWFCGQECAAQYEREFGVRFERNENGDVSYY